jgi:hypothetical protein
MTTIQELRALRDAIARAAGLGIFTPDSPAGLAWDRLTRLIVRRIMEQG